MIHNDAKFFNLAKAYARSYKTLENRNHQGKRFRLMTQNKAHALAKKMRGTPETVESLMDEFYQCVQDLRFGHLQFVLTEA